MWLNRTRERLLNGETVFGCAIQHYASPEIPRALAAAGFDYTFIDAEHSGFDLGTLELLVDTSARAGITPLVRVSDVKYTLVARMLDIGAHGVILPRVECPQLLAEAISWARFPPVGKRGFGLTPPRIDYAPRSMAEIIEHANRNVLVIAQLETVRALECCEDLLRVPGLDGALVGPADLSISMGIPGEMDHPKLRNAIERVIALCQHHGVFPAIQCRDATQARYWADHGMRMAGAGGEHGLFFEKARETVTALRARQPAPS